ncbi:MAG: FAD binding domain-containing protein, partial [Myxococcota bacterium]
AEEVRVGAMVTMAEAARHSEVGERFGAAQDALLKAASAQLRNAATLGGNLLQRTRCSYFRDGSSPCNKRQPGQGCAAQGGDTRGLAILGTSPSCVANYPGDFAVALVALGASVTVCDASGAGRTLLVEELHRTPEDTPHVETTLAPGELITSIHIPKRGWSASAYTKVRDRASYAFALVSAAVALRLDPETGLIEEAGVALGGLAAKPWRCPGVEDALRGARVSEEHALEAAQACLKDATLDAHQVFKVELGRRTVARAILEAASRASQDAS